jgi:murein DD-endopeptidase MepM/ murein hydrolase activator NlpD
VTSLTLTALVVTCGGVAMALRLPQSAAALPAGRTEPLGRVAAQAGTAVDGAAVRTLLTKTAASASAKAPAPAPSATPKHSAPPPPPPVYLNPFRSITGLIPQRIDMGADFAGSGPVYPIGDAVVTSATGSNWGWPGGGWVTYQLTDGPAAGLMVYVAEDVQPTVQVGEHVTPSTVIAEMSNGPDGIETGWAMPDGSSAESQLAVAGGISGGGPFPTLVGANFDQLLVALGVPAAPNSGQYAYGALPSGYPTSWPGL